MKKIVVLLLTIFVCLFVQAQNNDNQRYLLTTKSSTFGVGLSDIIDPYLSPLVYSGVGLNYNLDTRRFLSDKNSNYLMQSKLVLSSDFLLNPALSSEMIYLGINYGWGLNYHFRLNKNLKILAGGLWNIDFGFKNVSRNINNPVNLDMSTNLNLTGLLMYDWVLHTRTLHLQAYLQMPLIGCMFVPSGGASYYDMFEVGNLDQAFHFSSIHNKQGLNQTYTVDVPFYRSTWRFGLNFQRIKYKANDLVFKQDGMSLIVGTTFDDISFGGRKKLAPHNFISINE